MTSKIASIANLALQVFSGLEGNPHVSQGSISKEQLTNLAHLVNSITPQDLGFDYRSVMESAGGHHHSAPVIYSHIMENQVFSMGIFVLRPGSRIPLHDHPGMYGIAKVIYGALRCRSYSRTERSRCAVQDLPLSRWQLSDLVTVRLHQDIILTSASEPCLLTPCEGNYHEMLAVDGGAAFLDILAPPYDHDLGTRECHFYREVTLPLLSPGGSTNSVIPPSSPTPTHEAAPPHHTHPSTPPAPLASTNNNSVVDPPGSILEACGGVSVAAITTNNGSTSQRTTAVYNTRNNSNSSTDTTNSDMTLSSNSSTSANTVCSQLPRSRTGGIQAMSTSNVSLSVAPNHQETRQRHRSSSPVSVVNNSSVVVGVNPLLSGPMGPPQATVNHPTAPPPTNGNKVFLVETPQPKDFWSESTAYRGPRVS